MSKKVHLTFIQGEIRGMKYDPLSQELGTTLSTHNVLIIYSTIYQAIVWGSLLTSQWCNTGSYFHVGMYVLYVHMHFIVDNKYHTMLYPIT